MVVEAGAGGVCDADNLAGSFATARVASSLGGVVGQEEDSVSFDVLLLLELAFRSPRALRSRFSCLRCSIC